MFDPLRRVLLGTLDNAAVGSKTKSGQADFFRIAAFHDRRDNGDCFFLRRGDVIVAAVQRIGQNGRWFQALVCGCFDRR